MESPVDMICKTHTEVELSIAELELTALFTKRQLQE